MAPGGLSVTTRIRMRATSITHVGGWQDDFRLGKLLARLSHRYVMTRLIRYRDAGHPLMATSALQSRRISFQLATVRLPAFTSPADGVAVYPVEEPVNQVPLACSLYRAQRRHVSAHDLRSNAMGTDVMQSAS